jgi:Subtilase family
MEWNLKINGRMVKWQLSDTVAIVPPPDFPFPGPEKREPINGKFSEKANGKYPEKTNGKYPEKTNGDLIREDPAKRQQQDLLTFERAGWRFVSPADLPQRQRNSARQVFTNESGDVLIEPDTATVQLNAACMTKYQTAKKVLAEDGLTIVQQLCFAPHLYVVRLPPKRSLAETITALQAKTHRYVFAEPSMLQRISGRRDPSDPLFGLQWQHSQANGLDSVAAWEITKGVGPERPVRIAIIDNGMEIRHDELRTAIVGGGYFRSNRPGTATATFVRYQPGMRGFPDWGHGTFCLGMAGARENNGNGGCGIAPESDLLAIACAVDQTGSQLTLAQSIQFAIDPKSVDPDGDVELGADVISCSLSAANHVETVLEMAINSAASGRDGLGVPIFWAVSNLNTQISSDLLCSLSNVIAVGRSGSDGRPFQCGRGPKLEFFAPGLDVWGPSINNRNIKWSGTSFATPLAAGVAALVMSLHPDWTADQVVQRLRDTCVMPTHIAAENDRYGHGRINAHLAVLGPV